MIACDTKNKPMKYFRIFKTGVVIDDMVLAVEIEFGKAQNNNQSIKVDMQTFVAEAAGIMASLDSYERAKIVDIIQRGVRR